MPAAVDRRDMEGVGEAVEAERAGERDHMPAVDEPPAEAPLPLAELVEMHFRGVLVEPGRRLVLGLFDGDAVDMIDPFAGAIVLEPMRRSAELPVERGAVDRRTGCAEIGRRRPPRGAWERGSQARAALASRFLHHHPADIIDNRLAALIEPLRAHIDDAALPVRVLLEPDHLRNGGERVAGERPASRTGNRRSRDWRPRSARRRTPSCRTRHGRRADRRSGLRDSRWRARRFPRSAARSARR